MHYDQSWMGFGIVGGLEAGGITLVAAIILYLIMDAIGRKSGWSPLRKIAIALLLSLLLTATGDTWDLFYFNFGQVQSIQYLQARLAEVHDPDSIGLRVFCEILGAIIGPTLAWAVRGGDWRALFRTH